MGFKFKEYEGIIICECGHGKPHHNGAFGECTCKVNTMKEFVYKQCKCQVLTVVKHILNGKELDIEEIQY